MELTGSDVERIYAEIAAAGLDPGRWQTVVDLLSANSGIRAHLWGFDQSSAAGEFFVSHGIETDLLASFARHYAPLNPWPTSLAVGPVGQPLSTEAMCPYEELRRTEFHADWLRPQGDISAGGGVVLVREPGRYLAMGGMIEQRRRKQDEVRWLELLLRIAPALAQALEMNRTLSHMALRVIAAEQAPGAEVAAALVINRDRRIVLANASAEALLSQSRIVASDGMGRLRLAGDRAHFRLQTALARLATGVTLGSVAIDLDEIPHGPVFECRVAPFPPTDLPFAPLGPKIYPLHELVVVIVRTKPQASNAKEGLCRTFGLSAAEAEVALALAEGLTTEEIAFHRRVSIHTVRGQIKSVRSKTNSRRQADIVRLVEALRRPR